MRIIGYGIGELAKIGGGLIFLYWPKKTCFRVKKYTKLSSDYGKNNLTPKYVLLYISSKHIHFVLFSIY